MNNDQRRAFSRSMLRIIDGVLADELTPLAAAVRLRRGADWLRRIEANPECKDSISPDESVSLGPSRAEIVELFEHWRETTRRPRAQLSPKREQLYRFALKRFSAEQIKHITVWVAQDDHYSGANDRNKRYDWPETFLRSIGRIEDLLERSDWREDRKAKVVDIKTARRYKEIEDRSEEALREGKVDEYNQLQLQLQEFN